ncbi:uncharacterized protein BJ171DRAFT_524283 [Polychytrium aggregatum]|uniref:uncharacterized protein n=1 Tax=Polychytrium aggregatum TaxID=110093 RepID=UPI0022FE4B9C|nr:uncharacterized protein BJ171DRAFT_524283 [Polychytrium aggregatum]KAI9193700.1 hypothetical protein BJ171DRAFT_524283 [Polychytrium aggregatum]
MAAALANPTIDQLLRQLNSLFADACRQASLVAPDTRDPEPSASTARSSVGTTATAHPFAIETAKLREEWTSLLDQIEDILATYRDHVLPAISTPQDIKTFNVVLGERANAQGTLSLTQSAVVDCVNALREYQSARPVPLSLAMNKVESLSKQLGLQIFPNSQEDSDLKTVTICGSYFLVDIHTMPDGTIPKINLQYTNDQDLPQSDTSGTLSTHSDKFLLESTSDFNTFQDILKYFTFIDNIPFEPKDRNFDMFQVLRAVKNDLAAIYKEELEHSLSDHYSIIRHGHGIPQYDIGRFGPSCVYWITPESCLDLNWIEMKEYKDHIPDLKEITGAYRAFISIKASPEPQAFCCKPLENYLLTSQGKNIQPWIGDLSADSLPTVESTGWRNQLRFQFFKPETQISMMGRPVLVANAAFALILDPPVFLTRNAAQALAESVGMHTPASISTTAETSTQPPNVNEHVPIEPTVASTLEEVLARSLTREQPDLEPMGIASMRFRTTTGNLVQNIYFAARSRHEAVEVRHIRFQNPAQLFPIFQTLRKHIAFSALFQSCFNEFTLESPHNLPSSTISSKIILQLTHWQPPDSITFSLLSVPVFKKVLLKFQISDEIDLMQPRDDWIRFEIYTKTPESKEPFAVNFDEADHAKLCDLINRSANIPVFVWALIEKLGL